MGKSGRCVRLTTLPPSCAIVTKSGNLGPVTGLIYLYHLIQFNRRTEFHKRWISGKDFILISLFRPVGWSNYIAFIIIISSRGLMMEGELQSKTLSLKSWNSLDLTLEIPQLSYFKSPTSCSRDSCDSQNKLKLFSCSELRDWLLNGRGLCLLICTKLMYKYNSG